MFYEKKKIYKGCIENVFIKLRDFVIFERVCKDKRNISKWCQNRRYDDDETRLLFIHCTKYTKKKNVNNSF